MQKTNHFPVKWGIRSNWEFAPRDTSPPPEIAFNRNVASPGGPAGAIPHAITPWLIVVLVVVLLSGKLDRVTLLNDLEAIAHAVPHLLPSETVEINPGQPMEHAPAAAWWRLRLR